MAGMPGLAPLPSEMPQGTLSLEQARLPILQETHAALNILQTSIGAVLPIAGVAALIAGGIYTIVRGEFPKSLKIL